MESKTARAALAFILAFTSSTFASVNQIQKGTPAPYDGYIFDQPSFDEATQDKIDANYYKALSDKQAEKIAVEENESKILDERLQLYMKESDTLAKDRINSDFNEKLLLFGSFSLGVIVTALVFRNVRP